MTLEATIGEIVDRAVRAALEERLPTILANFAAPPDPDKGYAIAEAAQYLSVTEATIRERIKAGELEAIRLGKYTVIPHSSIQALVQRELAKARVNHLPAVDVDGIDDDITRELGLTPARRTAMKKAPRERRQHL